MQMCRCLVRMMEIVGVFVRINGRGSVQAVMASMFAWSLCSASLAQIGFTDVFCLRRLANPPLAADDDLPRDLLP